VMRLMVSQNAPFLPIYNAWHNHSREMLSYDATAARRDAATIEAKVLSNRKPPYAIAGGLFDALQATNGDVLRAINIEVQRATQLFLDTENADIHPAAAVAVATLIAEVQRGRIERDATIMLNITGGGERRYKSEQNISYIKPSYIFPLAPDCDDVITKVEKLFQ